MMLYINEQDILMMIVDIVRWIRLLIMLNRLRQR
jgi:hypothetical protein